MADTYRTGDPYRLGGRRLYFTNWHHVQCEGGHDWKDKNGRFPGIMTQRPADDKDIVWRPRHPNQGIRLVVRQALKSGPLFQYDKPWEGRGLSATILQDGSKFRAYCTSGWHFDRSAKDNALCYMESDDGYDWRKPELGVYSYEGSTANNILDNRNGFQLHPGCVFLDPTAPPEERYKWLNEEHYHLGDFLAYSEHRPDAIDIKSLREDVRSAYSNIHSGASDTGLYIGVKGAVSPDGIHWRFLDEPLVMTHADTHPCAYYDASLQKIVFYFRDYMTGRTADIPFEGVRWSSWKRSVGRAESTDFRNIPLPELCLVPDAGWSPNHQIYTICRTSMPGAANSHVMFPGIWNTGEDTSFVCFASSFDGRIWQYLSTGPVIPQSDYGQWDGGYMFAYPELLELPDGSFALPYTGYDVPHKYPRGMCHRNVGYALWPKRRLCGIEAAETGGFTTVAVVAEGERLLVNAVTKRAGFLQVEACDMDGRAIPGRTFEDCVPLVGDCFDTPVVWKDQDTLGVKPEAAIMLRVRMSRAMLYDFTFAD